MNERVMSFNAVRTHRLRFGRCVLCPRSILIACTLDLDKELRAARLGPSLCARKRDSCAEPLVRGERPPATGGMPRRRQCLGELVEILVEDRRLMGLQGFGDARDQLMELLDILECLGRSEAALLRQLA